MTLFDYWLYGILALVFVGNNAYWIGRLVEREKRWPEIASLRDEAAKYKTLYELSKTP